MAATRTPSSTFLSLWNTAAKGKSRAQPLFNQARSISTTSKAASPSVAAAPSAASTSSSASAAPPQALTTSTSHALSLLRTQPSHYIVASLVGRVFTLHPRDVVTVPRLRDVEVGDVLELDRIHEVGSRDYTLRAQDPMGGRERVAADMAKRRRVEGGPQSVASRLAAAAAAEGSQEPLRLSSSWTTQHLLPAGLAHAGAVLSPQTVRARAVVVEHTKGALEKIVKFKRRKGYKKTIQHKQGYTRIRLEAVRLGEA